MSFPRHFFTAIQVQKFIHLWRCQTIPNLQILHDEHLPGHRVLHEARRAFWFAGRVDLMLKLHLHRRKEYRTTSTLYLKQIFSFRCKISHIFIKFSASDSAFREQCNTPTFVHIFTINPRVLDHTRISLTDISYLTLVKSPSFSSKTFNRIKS